MMRLVRGRRHEVMAWVVGASLVAISLTAGAAAIKAATGSNDDAQRLGVAAAALTVAVIAFQSWETRRASEAAARALTESRRSVEVAERIELEAAKTRLDARAARLLITIGTPLWPPRNQGLWQGAEPNDFRSDHVFRLPGDASQVLVLEVEGRIRNEGDHTAQVRLNNVRVKEPYVTVESTPAGTTNVTAWRWSEPKADRLEEVGPDREVQFLLREIRSVAEWLSNTEAAERGEVGPVSIVAEIIYSDPFDNGVVDNWRLKLDGHPLVRVAGETNAWRFSGDTVDGLPIAATVLPLQRRYFHSKRGNDPFPAGW